MTPIERVALLAGGTGGAKLAAGMQARLGESLTVIANTADDCEVHGLHVSPDPDLCTYWLAGQIDEAKGWGIEGDSFTVHERLAELGAPDWFSLSDRDLATCIYRTHFMAEGGTLTAAQGQIARGLGVAANVLPMCDEPVRTHIHTPAGRRGLQEFLIIDHGEAPIEGVEVEGLAEARPTSEVLAAVANADLIVIGPSNPVISIGPILAVPGMREAMSEATARIVAVSPFVAGRAIKGPTEAFMAAVGRPVSAAGVASLYEGLLDGIVVDEGDPDPPPEGLEALVCPTLMEGAGGRRAVAERILEWA
ncbi:MAG TPA: 2-phospho-L-lactate transferase [Solirubrobacterales bacterium]|nr:2-phospho-L-lactate transferase [Solirubrobacterales bacterium]